MSEQPVQGYKIIYRGGSGEIVEKKSRFIAHVEKAETEEEAVNYINSLKKQYWDARHNCYAFVIGSNMEITRCSDDGEPSGTAGRPILDVLLREEIHNCVIVVTRYFGGVLLGTGGLVRAYQKAAQEGLSEAAVVWKRCGIRLDVTVDYNGIGKLQYITAQKNIPCIDTEYAEEVVMHLLVPLHRREELEKAVTESTNGTAILEYGAEAEYVETDGTVELL
ncbi:MAG: YigZ family protein [Eubacterium sp.]|jgi:uncharacterized protein, YigZ family|nr:YigZ family protein [Eubacterium sp.]